jgi:CHAT domain-containing protein
LDAADPLTSESLRQVLLQTKGTILEYFLSETELYIWIVRPASGRPDAPAVHLRRVAIGKQAITAKVRQLLGLLEEIADHPVLDSRAIASGLLRGLYQDLIAPVEELLPKNPADPVIIVPHKSLSFVPFAALIRGGEGPNAPQRRFIEDHGVTYIPSLGVLRLIRDARPQTPLPANPSVLAIINPEFGPDVRDLSNQPFAQLPPQLVADAMDVLDKYYDKQVTKRLVGKEATPAAVLEQAQSPDVLLFLTHAEADENNLNGSYVALAGGKLPVSDFGALRLKSRLVMFGACQTGRGEVNSDGVMSMTRMTLAAGAQNVLVSLWKVPDAQTMELIQFFHDAWRRGKPIAEAFRQAQLAMFEMYPDQALLWAGFILVGGDQ